MNEAGTAYVLTSYTGDATSVTVPATYLGLPVTEVGEAAFEFMSEVTEVILPDSITHIGECAFYASGLTSIAVSKSVVSIGMGAFNTENMESMTVASGNPIYHSSGNCIIETQSKTLIAGCKTGVIPDNGSVTVIGTGAFARCPLTEIVIPAAVTTIAPFAFTECDELESVTFGTNSQLISIGVSAFHECCSLTDIELPQSLVTIGEGAFYCCCSLEEITLGSAVASIGEQAFADCDGLEKITVRSAGVAIFEGEDTISETAVIYGYADSTAQAYAEAYGREFVELAPYTPGDIDGVEGVNKNDAIYLLMYVYFSEEYPVDQSCDFDGDGSVNKNDAIYLLMHVYFQEEYPIS